MGATFSQCEGGSEVVRIVEEKKNIEEEAEGDRMIKGEGKGFLYIYLYTIRQENSCYNKKQYQKQ